LKLLPDLFVIRARRVVLKEKLFDVNVDPHVQAFDPLDNIEII
jgi:hypothetical protein